MPDWNYYGLARTYIELDGTKTVETPAPVLGIEAWAKPWQVCPCGSQEHPKAGHPVKKRPGLVSEVAMKLLDLQDQEKINKLKLAMDKAIAENYELLCKQAIPRISIAAKQELSDQGFIKRDWFGPVIEQSVTKICPAPVTCRLGSACTHHTKPAKEPYVGSVDDWDLLPDA